jgi:hypothetical protein
MSEDINDDDQALEERMRAALGVQEKSKEEVAADTKAKTDPRPVKILLERVREWGDIGYGESAVHWRYFIYAVDAAGKRKQIINTTSNAFAQREYKRYADMGVPVEVLKEHTI